MAWEKVTSNNVQYDLFRQDKNHSCGVACGLMVLNILQKKRLNENQLLQYFRNAEPTTHRDASGKHDFNHWGISPSTLIGFLSYFKIKTVQIKTEIYIYNHLQEVTPRKPVVIGISWGNQGGHFAVCVNWGEFNNFWCFTILDPFYGLVEYNNALFPQYKPNNLVTGTIVSLFQVYN